MIDSPSPPSYTKLTGRVVSTYISTGVREISEEEVERALQQPEFVVSGDADRQIYLLRYHDSILAQEMLLRVIVEETDTERVVVTVHETSQIARYLKGLSK